MFAEDYGTPSLRSESVDVRMHVIDRLQPVFRKHVYHVSVNENSAVGTQLLSVQAEGAGINDSMIIYSIVDGDPNWQFDIDYVTGTVAIAKKLDYEEFHNYSLRIRASDFKLDTHTDAQIVIHVEDFNDVTPKFFNYTHFTSISELAPVDSFVAKVCALDGDSGNNGLLSYRLLNDSGTFRISSENRCGIIALGSTLNFHERKKYEILVEAFDHGIPSLSAQMPMEILVLPRNHPPVFSQLSFEAELLESAEIGEFVAVVTGTDEDSESQGRLHYSFVDKDEGTVLIAFYFLI